MIDRLRELKETMNSETVSYSKFFSVTESQKQKQCFEHSLCIQNTEFHLKKKDYKRNILYSQVIMKRSANE